MKKVTLFLAAAALLASCNREIGDDLTNGPNQKSTNTVHFSQSDLDGQLIPMSQSFNISSKAAVQLNYTYRAYAEPVNFGTWDHDGDNGTVTPEVPLNLAASAIFSVNDMVFVTWHMTDGPLAAGASSPLGGSITAYKQTGIGQYTFMDRVDFTDADYHELYVYQNTSSGHYEVFAVGQRNVQSSGYLLAGHNGAVVTRVDYDYLNDEFWEPGVTELPLPGVSANDIVAGASNYYVITGNGNGGSGGGIYEMDRNLAQVKKFNSTINDGIALEIDRTWSNSSHSYIYALDRQGTSKFRIHYLHTDNTGPSGITTWASDLNFVSDYNTGALGGINYERGDLTWAQRSGWGSSNPTDSLIASFGYYGIYSAGNGVGGMNHLKDLGPCLSTEFDEGLNVLYYADGDDGVSVLAMAGFNGGALINTYDVIGQFVPPTGGAFPSTFLVKELTVYQSRNIAMATGDAGVYFMQRNKF